MLRGGVAAKPLMTFAKHFTNVKDNSWCEVTWTDAVFGRFRVAQERNRGRWGAWGKNGKIHIQVLVDGQWFDVEGHEAGETPYLDWEPFTFKTDHRITGLRLQTPTWCETTAGGRVKVELGLSHYTFLIAAFQAADPLGTGEMSREQLGNMLQNIDPATYTDEAVDALVDAADCNNDGKIQLQEWVAWVMGPPPLPQYWTNFRGTTAKGAEFDQMYLVSEEHHNVFNQLLAQSYKSRATRDRRCPKKTDACPSTPGGCPCVQPGGDPGLPVCYLVRQVIRVESSAIWARYMMKKDEIRRKRIDESIQRFDPLVVTHQLCRRHEEVFAPLSEDMNEVYLLHGTGVRTTLAIAQNDFNINLAGSNAGTMYGRGCYLGENCTKADEYASDEPGGYYNGVYAMVLCRTLMGKFFYTESRDENAGDHVSAGSFDSTCGDRTKSVDTFREFVVYDNSQVYPEYVIMYNKVYAKDDPEVVENIVSQTLHLELPVYWQNCHKNPHVDSFDDIVNLKGEEFDALQRIVNKCLTSGSAKLVDARRVEDSNQWKRYVNFKQSLRDSATKTTVYKDFAEEFINVQDNSWSEVTWSHLEAVFGNIRVTQTRKWGKWGAWGENGKVLIQVLVDGQWLSVDGHQGGGKPYLDWEPQIFYTEHRVTGVRLKTPTWCETTAGGEIKVELLSRALNFKSAHDLDADSGDILTMSSFAEEDPDGAISVRNLESEMNEATLWHGSSKLAVESIADGGFRIARGNDCNFIPRFGEGVYFAEHLEKSLMYAKKEDGLQYILLCRVCCGDFYYTELDKELDASRKCESDGKNCVLANPINMKRQAYSHREFIALGENQVYPEYILTLKCS